VFGSGGNQWFKFFAVIFVIGETFILYVFLSLAYYPLVRG